MLYLFFLKLTIIKKVTFIVMTFQVYARRFNIPGMLISKRFRIHAVLNVVFCFQWRLLEMSGVERRRLCCAVLFHCVAALCVMWSLFVLIERAVEEVNRGLIGNVTSFVLNYPALIVRWRHLMYRAHINIFDIIVLAQLQLTYKTN